MSFGLRITNNDGYMTFTDNNAYYEYREKLTSSQATYQFGQRFYWTTTYDGSTFPLVFIYSNGKFCTIIDTFRNANGTWQIHVWTDYGEATNTLNAIEGYVFTDSSQTSTTASYGIRLRDANGNQIYNSNFQLINVKDFATVPASATSTVSCGSTSSGVYSQQSTNHNVSGLTKPAAVLYSNAATYSSCTVYVPGWGNFSGCRFWRAVHKVTSTAIITGWAYYGELFGGCNNTMYSFQAYTTPVIDGNDY